MNDRNNYYDTDGILDEYDQLLNELNRQSSSKFSTNIKQRSVLLPKMCYFSRVASSGIYRKLCLP